MRVLVFVSQEAPGGKSLATQRRLAADEERTRLLQEVEHETDGCAQPSFA